MLFTLWKRRPDEFVITWDSPQQTIRKQQYTEYKANRVRMPDEFKRQMRTIKDIVQDIGIPFLEMPGYEADDIIATIVRRQQEI
jgi:DNA polymerase I